MFVSFDKSRCRADVPDFFERTGNFLLHCVARGINVLYCVKQIPNYPSCYFSHKEISCCRRIANIVICILTGPLMLLATVLGLLAYRFSSTYQTSLQERFRYKYEQKQALDEYRDREEKVITLQKFCRGFLVRNHLLNQETLTTCKQWGQKLLEGEKFPRVPEGRSLVYISKQFPSLVENFLFEEKLPVSRISVDSMCLYKENPQAFDEAIKELLFLFKEVHFRDFVVETESPTDDFPLAVKVHNYWVCPRYDNLPLFIQEGKDGSPEGRIGLVDLETFSWSPHPCPVEELAVMFPMHKELLMTEAKKLQIPFSTKEVERSVEKGLAFFEHMLGHQDFCSQKSVTPLRNCAPYIHLEVWRFSLKIFDILKAAIQLNGALNVLLSPDIRERLSAISDKQWLAISSQVTSSLLEQVSTNIYQSHTEEAKRVNSSGTFIMCRSPIFRKSIFIKNLPELLNKKLQLLPEEKEISEALASLCLRAVMEELVATGNIYSYDSMDDFFEGQYCRIRY
ncbi:hypothetical protein L11322_00167 [Chlamydia trachomatis L1/1322/p2]|uniref:hypothetical protein n=1 Tax=Chlamydia trachomatis TaxID=813 RepID=UPI0002A7BE81|nr:hypothetical protein [Chlamydia trachomatis]CCP63089.1 hypothetical protein L11322_00167 [Chlamydia trachomatis L1/1322/p2]CRH25320.1 IQ calmodulin-binding motif family protein [Chlamydia trachomatis]CRH27252.1 IQ calmodulin-binding motif family protein [Chlamydia trachomatis]